MLPTFRLPFPRKNTDFEVDIRFMNIIYKHRGDIFSIAFFEKKKELRLMKNGMFLAR